MTTTATRNRMTRRTARQLRDEVASIKTYWHAAGEALAEIENILRRYGLDLGEQMSQTEAYGSHRYTYEVVSDEDGTVLDDTMLVYSTYKMPSGRTEVVAYLS